MQIYSIAQRKITSFYLSNCLVEKGMESCKIDVVKLPGASSHEIVPKWNVVSFTQSSCRVIFGLEHLGYHDLSQGVFMNAAWPFVYKHIVVDLCEASDAVVEWDS